MSNGNKIGVICKTRNCKIEHMSKKKKKKTNTSTMY